MPILPSYAGCTLATVLKTAPLDPLENRILLCHALRLTRVQLITQSERQLSAAEAETLAALLARRLRGEPIAYIVGQREFYGLDLRVSPDVLIPRPDTELLVELALERLPQGGSALDMGTGSGAIAVAIAHTRPDAQVTALDASPAALAIARENASTHQVRVRLLESDWYGALDADQAFDLIVSNPPYIVAGDIHLSQGDLRFEPVDALTDHADGLSDLRTIIEGAPAHLKAGGWLLMEHGYDQAAAVRALLTGGGWREVQSWRDLAGIERVSGARLG
ncbi:peptide chain release factor N(5)-glutamine methyltransferase [Herbaspirillum seropedicae]|uniref:Release factor glutamine methyltransferase n=1 Tax=Herbaspirillum seropedicae (strain SmR1) TaxID=757424 RepID=D8IUL4_HERSS|nr:peptide chain release factor N(5)-glutamine methyltransferase [Herbaspirillum seropedicae]ADJ65746.1 polypeptide chain release factors methylase protein [Herbaspirillum seropedicae SmR1]AKN67548.1 SAM-dependent methyltransferase [Herbaspirillum seropedicae]AON56634.1 polypeptide chain release factors methylase [Herbaspirillum seropedicae]NQE29592.1 SAM-dependent methyltransferase [Herbaspirillum seropedicae]UMU23561.1 peptide chain release factor N(5)-glutamine methyltransferase [Herbaspiri